MLDDRTGDFFPAPTVYEANMRLHLEVNVLRSQMNSAVRARSLAEEELERERKEKELAMQPKRIVEMVARCVPSLMHETRSLARKVALLREAEASLDTEVHEAVLRFVAGSLDREVFHRALADLPVSRQLWTTVLERDDDLRGLVLLFRHFGMVREEGMLRVKTAFRNPDVLQRRSALAEALAFMRARPECFDELVMESVSHTILLIARQVAIESLDARREAEGAALFRAIPRRSIAHAPLAFTLYYCLLHHSRGADGPVSDPAAIQKDFAMSDKTVEYLKLKALTRLGNWEAVRQIPKRGWLSRSATTKISPMLFLDALVEARAPRAVQAEFAASIEPPELRFSAGLKHQLYEVVVDVLCDHFKDQVKLVELRNHMLYRHGAAATERARQEIERIVSPANPRKVKWKRLVDPNDV